MDLARALRWAKNQFDLDPQPDQDLLSPETGADVALGFIPGVGQAMALRDMERARRAEDPVAGGLAAAGLIPFGRLGGALKNQIIAGRKAAKAPLDDLQAAEDYLTIGGDAARKKAWDKFGAYSGAENHAPMKWEISDQPAVIQRWDTTQGPKGRPQVGNFEGKLSEFLRHPEFFENYPQARDWTVSAKLDPWDPSSGNGSYWNKGKTQTGVPHLDVSGVDEDELMRTLLHEIQHGVQRIEGFDSGANPGAIKRAIVDNLRAKADSSGTKLNSSVLKDAEKQANELYNLNMGEAEARMVEKRLFDMSGMPESKLDRPRDMLLSEDMLPTGRKLFGPVFPKASEKNLHEIAKQAGNKMYGKSGSGLIWGDEPTTRNMTTHDIVRELVENVGDDARDLDFHTFGDYEFGFKPSTGEGLNSGNFVKDAKKLMDKDGKIYTVNNEGAGPEVRIITPTIHSEAELQKYIDELLNERR